MNTFRLLIATVSSLAVMGSAGVALAQTPPSATSNSGTPTQYQTQNQNPVQNPDRMSNTTTPGSTNSTTPRQSDSATSTDNSGSSVGRSTDGTLRNADGSTMRAERLARADRN